MSRGHAIVSGGSSGIGLALARLLATAGSDVTIVARGTERLAGARAGIEAARKDKDQRVLAFSADVADEPAVANAVRTAIAELGPPNLVVANAGMVVPGLFEDIPLDAFGRTIAVNYLGAVHLIRAALPAMREAGVGRIVLVSSGAGLIGLYGYTAYAPSKFAVRGLAEALRSELRPDEIGVSLVYPPDTDTPQLTEEVRVRPDVTSRIAAGAKMLSPDQVARAILDGVARGRFVIAPGWEMKALAAAHSFLGPLLNRFWFDRVVAKHHVASRSGRDRPRIFE
jgi:3-dehydrosphinganine reductase